jgi:P4 family phage/plasmid primase-like protien
VTDPLNPADAFNERANEKERQERLQPKGKRVEVVHPDLADHATADGLGTLDTDLKHAFLSKYGHLFCMDLGPKGKGSDLFAYNVQRGMWFSGSVRELINAQVSTMSVDVIRNQFNILLEDIRTAPQERRDELDRQRQHLSKLIQRWGRASTISQISTLVYNHLKSVHEPRPVEMNPNPWHLNCTNGVVDLETGTLHWRQPDHYLTVCTDTVFDPHADYSRWEKVVRQICLEKEDMYEFLHTWIGYSITGLRRDHGLVMMFGKGSNGKSLFIDVIARTLGAYAGKLPQGFLENKKGGTDNNEQYALASLNGIRFAHGSETEDNAELKAGTIKAITGDDTITARGSHENYKTFRATHKITIATNHKPIIPADDDAMFRRLFLFPAAAKFGPQEDVDNGDADYAVNQLLLEQCSTPQGRSEVLLWAVHAVDKYKKNGLKLPATIKHQVALHRSEMDIIGSFVRQATEYIGKPKIEELKSFVGTGGSKEKRETWKAMSMVQRCDIEYGLFYNMYQLWCKQNGIVRVKNRVQFNKYLKTAVRWWTDEVNKVELKMDAMEMQEGATMKTWRWVKLSYEGERLFHEAKGMQDFYDQHRT